MSLKSIDKHKFAFMVYLVLIILVFRSIFSPGYIGRNDWIPSFDWLQNLIRFPWTLDSFIHGGIFNLQLSVYPITVIQSLLEAVLGVSIVYRAYVVIASSCGLYSMYQLTNEYTENPFSAILAGLFYGLNPWVSSRILSSHYPLLLGYGLFPLFLKYFLPLLNQKILDSQTWTNLLYSAILIFFIGASVPLHNVFLLFLTVIPLIFSKLGFSVINKTLKDFASKLLFLGFPLLILSLLLCMYWILPFGQMFLYGEKPVSDLVYSTWLHQNLTPLNILRLTGYWWSPFSLSLYTSQIPLIFPIWQIISLIPFIFTLPVLLKKPENSNQFGFQLLFVFSFVLNLGSYFFGDYYYSSLEIMGLFRDPDKYGAIVALTISFLLSQSIDQILSILNENRKKIFVIFMFVVFCITNYPALTGDFKSNHSTFSMPDEYFKVNQWLESQSDEGLVLWVPADVYMAFNWTNSKFIGDFSQFYSGIATLNPIMDSSRELKPMVNHLINYAVEEIDSNNTEQLGKFLGLHNVKYIVIRADAVSPFVGESFLHSNWENSGFYLVHSDSPLFVYENRYYQSNFRLVNQTFLVSGGPNELRKLGYLLPDFNGYAFQMTDYSNTTIADVDVFFGSLSLQDSILQAIPSINVFSPSDYAAEPSNSDGWSFSPFFKHQKYALKEPLVAVTYDEDSEMVIPYDSSISDNHFIFIRGVGPYSTLNISLGDKEFVEHHLPWKTSWSFVGAVPLSQGLHTLSITSNIVQSEILLDQIIIISQADYEDIEHIVHQSLFNKSFLLFKEAEDIIMPTTSLIINPLFSNNKGVQLNGGAQISDNTAFYCPQDGYYRIHFLGNSTIGSTILTVFNSDVFTESVTVPLNSSYGWQFSNPIFLQNGSYSVYIRSSSAIIDMIALSKSEDIHYFEPNEAYDLTIIDQTPTSYHVSSPLNISSVVFTTAYNDWWKSTSNGVDVSIEQVELYNMKIDLPQNNLQSLTIYYELQMWGNIGWIVTILSLIGVILTNIYLKTR